MTIGRRSSPSAPGAASDAAQSRTPNSLQQRLRPDELDGQSLGKYQLLMRLNGGGEGTVYLAHDVPLQRDVAIKVSRSLPGDDPRQPSRLLAEGALLAQINHPHLPKVYDCGIEGQLPYLVMEYVPGIPLHRYAESHPLRTAQIVQFLDEISAAVAAAHQAGILHLDLKPDNVMVTPEGHCKLVDFGLGWQQTERKSAPVPIIAGTCGYLAPEQLSGHIDQRSQATDVFGLGAVLYFLLTGKPPVDTETLDPAAIQNQIRTVAARLPKSREQRFLSKVCQRAMAIDPDQRFTNVNQFRRALHVRRRTWDRCCAGVCLVAGTLIAALPFFQIQPTEEVPRDRMAHFVAPVVDTRVRALQMRLEISSDDHVTPQLLIWIPDQGLQEIRGLAHQHVDGRHIWKPRGRSGILSTTLPDDFVCLIAFQEQIDLTQLNLTLADIDLAQAFSEFDKATLSAKGDTVLELSDRTDTGTTTDSHEAARKLMDALREELLRTQTPFRCVIGIPEWDSNSVWDWNVGFDFASKQQDLRTELQESGRDPEHLVWQ